MTTVVGTGGAGFGGDGGPATSAILFQPSSILFDPSGRLYIGDLGRVRRVNTAGIISTIIGASPTSDGFSNGASADSAQLSLSGIALDAEGNVLIADVGHHRVRKVIPNAGVPIITSISTQSGTQGTTVSAVLTGFNLSGVTALVFSGTAVTASVNGVAADTTLPIAITVSPSAITGRRTLSVFTSLRSSVSFDGFTVLPVPATPAPLITGFTWAVGIQGRSGTAAFLGTNLGGATAVNVSGNGVSMRILGGGTDTLLPVAVTITPDAPLGNRIFSITTPNGNTQEVSMLTVVPANSFSSDVIATFAGNGSSGFGGDGGPAIAAQLYPGQIAFDPEGNLLFLDHSNDRIRRIDRNGVITTFAGGRTTGDYGDGGPVSAARLNGAFGVAADLAGNVYIAEAFKVRKVNPAGVITTFAGGGAGVGDGGPATAAQLINPTGLLVDAQGNVYIADYSRVRKVNPAGIITTVAGNGTDAYFGDGGLATAASIKQAISLALDSIFTSPSSRGTEFAKSTPPVSSAPSSVMGRWGLPNKEIVARRAQPDCDFLVQSQWTVTTTCLFPTKHNESSWSMQRDRLAVLRGAARKGIQGMAALQIWPTSVFQAGWHSTVPEICFLQTPAIDEFA